MGRFFWGAPWASPEYPGLDVPACTSRDLDILETVVETESRGNSNNLL